MIRAAAGNKVVNPKRVVSGSECWARLEDAVLMAPLTLGQFLDALREQPAGHTNTATHRDTTPSPLQPHSHRPQSAMQATTTPSVVNLYVHDWSLPVNCGTDSGGLLDRLLLPPHVADDYLRMTPPNSLYRDVWPSLFVGKLCSLTFQTDSRVSRPRWDNLGAAC